MKFRIRDKRRFYIFTFTMMLILFMIPGIISLAKSNIKTECKVTYIIEGDTLWQIARNEVGNSMDVRKYIDEIKRVNNLKDPNIFIGQELKLPIKDF